MPATRRQVVLGRFGDVLSADLLVAFLRSHQIDAHVEGADPLSIALGARVRVALAEDDVRRARWAFENAHAWDGEAWFLATGELDAEEAKRAFARREDWQIPRMRTALRKVALGFVALFAVAALLAR